MTESNCMESVDNDVVTPWEVKATSDKGIDYDKLIEKFGCKRIDDEIIERLAESTKCAAHHLLRRKLFFSHRDFDIILKLKEQGKPFYLYTGRGPSSGSMHLGHLIPFMFTKWLQDVFDVPLVIQLTDDEKFLCTDDSFENIERYAVENMKDIIACGFDAEKTFIFTDTQYEMQERAFNKNIRHIGRKISRHKVDCVFGFDSETNICKVAFPAVQAAPAFSSTFPLIFNGRKDIGCLIPCAIDQDPYFRLTRDVAKSVGGVKPALIHSSFLPGLQGNKTKMSSSIPTSAIFLSDTPEQIKKKMNKYAFSGGKETAEEHRRLGGDCDVDVAFQYLRYLLEDDTKLEEIRQKFTSGEMLSGQLKAEAIQVLQKTIVEFQERRKLVTDQVIEDFRRPRKLVFDYPSKPNKSK